MRQVIKFLIAGFYIISLLVFADKPINHEIRLSKAEIDSTVQAIIDTLAQTHIYPEKMPAITQGLAYKLTSGELYQMNSLEDFIRIMNIQLRKSTNDSYFEVKNTPHQGITGLLEKSSNYSREIKVEIVDEKIGYLFLKGALFLSDVKSSIDHAFKYLADVETIIIDIRAVEKADLPLIQYLISYFIEPNISLGEAFHNQEARPQKILSLKHHGYARLKNNFPLYIINSAFVSGEWEFFSYTLKHFKKATIVGEATMGVAKVSKHIKVNNHVSITLPYMVIKHPISKENWEQRGVIPDVNARADNSLHVATKLAQKHIENNVLKQFDLR